MAIFTVKAAWNSKVISGQSLSKTLWNDMVNKLIDLDGRVQNIETSTVCIPCTHPGTSDSSGVCGECGGSEDDVKIWCTNGCITKIQIW